MSARVFKDDVDGWVGGCVDGFRGQGEEMEGGRPVQSASPVWVDKRRCAQGAQTGHLESARCSEGGVKTKRIDAYAVSRTVPDEMRLSMQPTARLKLSSE